MLKSCLFVCCAILLFGCKSKQENTIGIYGTHLSENLISIPVNSDAIVKHEKLSDFVDPESVTVIPLETCDSSLLGGLRQIKVKDNKIFFQDNLQKAVFVFSNQGKFITKIDHFGRGPEEYADLNDFCVKDNEVGMLNFDRLFFYHIETNEFVRQIYLDSLGIGGRYMYCDDNYYYFRMTNIQDIKASVAVCNKDFTLKTVLTESTFAELLTVAMAPFFVPIEDKVYYHQTFNDTLYHITDTGLIASYVFDCGENSLTYAQENQYMKAGQAVPDHYFYSLCQFYYADSILSFHLYHAQSSYFGFYSLKTGKLKLVDIKNCRDDIFNLGLYWNIWYSADGYFYGVNSAAVFLRKGLKAPAQSPFAGLTEDDNPVIIKFKLKDF